MPCHQSYIKNVLNPTFSTFSIRILNPTFSMSSILHFCLQCAQSAIIGYEEPRWGNEKRSKTLPDTFPARIPETDAAGSAQRRSELQTASWCCQLKSLFMQRWNYTRLYISFLIVHKITLCLYISISLNDIISQPNKLITNVIWVWQLVRCNSLSIMYFGDKCRHWLEFVVLVTQTCWYEGN